MKLPNRLFFTGVPGSKWSGISQILEKLDGVNTSDHTPERNYSHDDFTGHRCAYFGLGMEFTSDIETFKPEFREYHLDSPWVNTCGMKILKSHDWSYKLRFIRENYPNDWIMLVHRPKSASYDWWKKAGGFDISYPSYKCYENLSKMKDEIAAQNAAILQFSSEVEAQWSPFTPDWVLNTFGQKLDFQFPGSDDISVTVIK